MVRFWIISDCEYWLVRLGIVTDPAFFALAASKCDGLHLDLDVHIRSLEIGHDDRLLLAVIIKKSLLQRAQAHGRWFARELGRGRGAAKDGGTFEYVFEVAEQNSPNALN